MRFAKIAFVCICAWGAWHGYQTRPASKVSSGIVAPQAPEQGDILKAEFTVGKYQITPLASWKIEARVLSREDYRFDAGADLSPTDLALGWGRMSDVQVYSKLNVSQSNRFYFWRYDDEPPIPTDEIVRSSANMHLIPANEQVKEQIKRVRVGQIVKFAGQLIQAQNPAARWVWRSSMAREDSGAGACEVIWVESFEIEGS
jgi:hypothetical protein